MGCAGNPCPAVTCQPADATELEAMGSRGPCHIHPQAPQSYGKVAWGAALLLPRVTPTSFPRGHPSQLREGVRHPCLAFINPDGFPALTTRVTQPAFLAPAPTLQHITEVLQTTGLTQQGVKVCREVIVIISSSARAPDALRNKNGC